jgi:hypothetical protein
MTTATMTRDAIDAVLVKLDGLDITADERRLLRAAVRLAVDTSPPPGSGQKATSRLADSGIDVGSF